MEKITHVHEQRIPESEMDREGRVCLSGVRTIPGLKRAERERSVSLRRHSRHGVFELMSIPPGTRKTSSVDI